MLSKKIAELRKEKGLKQEDIAKYVCVSTQAVSKWENGGVPDVELLPKIAEILDVSIDTLFGRSIANDSDMENALAEKIINTPKEERFKLAFEYIWIIERALFGNQLNDISIARYEAELGEDEQNYSSIMQDDGFTRMGIANRLQYFLMVPEIKNTEKALFNGIDYISFFKDLSDKDFFDACVILNKRDSAKAFTPNYLIKNLNISEDKAKGIIEILRKYHLISTSGIEMDDTTLEVYYFVPTPSFIALLIFAREIIDKPDVFSYYMGGRKKPYLG